MSSFAPPCELEPGSLISGKYRIGRHIGAGGFGCVYEAENLALGTRVALKVRREVGADERLRREARIAARLQSPHSVRVYDVDCLADGTPYIVMELLEGESLRTYLKRQSTVDCAQALRWMLELCEALREAHDYGLVHRDIKPANLMVVQRAAGGLTVKLVDFGLAKSLAPKVDESLTESGILVGSPAYMSPEQVRGARATPESDIWSLGVVLYELLSGRRPFEGDSASAILAAIVADPPTPLHEVAARCPPRVHAIVERCLRKATADRFSSIQTLAGELRAALTEWDGQDAAVHKPAPEDSATISQVPPASNDFRKSTSAARRRRKPLLIALSAGLALVAWLWWLSSSTAIPERDSRVTATRSVTEVEPRAANGSPVITDNRELGSANEPPPETRPERAKSLPDERKPSDVAAPGPPAPQKSIVAPGSASAKRAPFLFEEPDF